MEAAFPKNDSRQGNFRKKGRICSISVLHIDSGKTLVNMRLLILCFASLWACKLIAHAACGQQPSVLNFSLSALVTTQPW